MCSYYFDTSIWLDFIEDRNEPNMPKGECAHQLLKKDIITDEIICYSDAIIIEFKAVGYSAFDIQGIFRPLRNVLAYVQSTHEQRRRAKDLASKRDVPRMDALHALIARDNHALLVTLDHHFKELSDITKPHRPQDLI